MKSGRGDSGFVLVTVLWTIALLTALAIAAAVTFRAFAGMVAVGHDATRANALLQAGLEQSADILLRQGNLPLTARSSVLMLGSGAIRMDLSDESGRIDINKAPVEVLASLFRATGVPEDQAAALAQAIASLRGDKKDASAQAGSPPPRQPAPAGGSSQDASGRNGDRFQAFTDVRQLLQIEGMTQDEVSAILPLTTTFGDGKVDVLTATPDVLAALPDMSPTLRDTLLEARDQPRLTEGRLRQLVGKAANYLALTSPTIARVVLTAQLPDGYARAARAVIVALPGDSEPYRVLAWTPVSVAEGFAAE